MIVDDSLHLFRQGQNLMAWICAYVVSQEKDTCEDRPIIQLLAVLSPSCYGFRNIRSK